MSNIEFKGYTATPGEKHLGIAEVKCTVTALYRYKIIPKKDGKGFFPASVSVKLVENGQERYVGSFTIDSNSDKEQIESIIMSNVSRIIQGHTHAFVTTQTAQTTQSGTYTPMSSFQSFSAPPMPNSFQGNTQDPNVPF